MNGLRESNCPICRDPYVHFPSVCQKLHFLLKKLYPIAYKQREKQVLKEEQEQGCFSPQIDVIDELKADEEIVCNGNSLNVLDEKNAEECSSASKLSSTSPSGSGSRSRTICDKERVNKQISRDDLLCSACKMLLVRPVVLNCGHVYCDGCVVDMAEESEKIRCPECHICDPRGYPKVCLAFEQLLEETFPEEYNSRRSGIKKTLAHNSKGNFQTYPKEDSTLSFDDDIPWWAHPGAQVHIGAGCDSCGVYPIVGERYRCKDCTEEIGYDLCKDCYHTRSKLPGRFNQQHTPDHRFELADVPQVMYMNREAEEGIAILVDATVNLNAEMGSDDHDDGEEVAHPDSNDSNQSNESSSSSA